MKQGKSTEIKVIFIFICLIFLLFLFFPLCFVIKNAFTQESGFTLSQWSTVITEKKFLLTVGRSLWVSIVSAVISTLLGFILAYTIQYTNVNTMIKKGIRAIAIMPMLLPTITYGFAIIYSFGKQGFLTKLIGKQFFEIYGFYGLVLGFVIYTLPIAFMLLNNTMLYIDKKFSIVSKVMGDTSGKTFKNTVLRPMLGTMAASFVQTFFLCFTDFGIPASVGGEYKVVASVLYQEMLGSVPNFSTGSVIAILMLLPSIISIAVLTYLERYNVRYQKISVIELEKKTSRDVSFGILSGIICIGVVSIFLVIFIIPFVEEWPYHIRFTFDHIKNSLHTANLGSVYKNSLIVSGITAFIGMIFSYGAALITARSSLNEKAKRVIESISLVTNTVPGMVLGIAYLLMFSGTSIQNTFLILILCNVIHYFSTPYLMFKNSLAKMNHSWETTALLMGDNWIKTMIRVVTPNAFSTMCEVLAYYFINSMVTISAVVFLVGAKTNVLTTKIKELQHFAKFNEIFILSLFILCTNIIVKIIFQVLANRKKR